MGSENLGLHQLAHLGAKSSSDFGWVHEGNGLTLETASNVVVSLCGRGLIVSECERFAPVGADNHLLIFEDKTQQRKGQNVRYVIHREHLLRAHHLWPHPVEDQLNWCDALGVQ